MSDFGYLIRASRKSSADPNHKHSFHINLPTLACLHIDAPFVSSRYRGHARALLENAGDFQPPIKPYKI